MIAKKDATPANSKDNASTSTDSVKRTTLSLKKDVKVPDNKVTSPTVVVTKPNDLKITPAMEVAIAESKKLVLDGCTKADAARDVYAKLVGLERKQIVYVFMMGCGLTKAGAGTYYQNCKTKCKKTL
jgi:hypothetical protein